MIAMSKKMDSMIATSFGFVTEADRAKWQAQRELKRAEKEGAVGRRALSDVGRGSEEFVDHALDIEMIAAQVQLASAERQDTEILSEAPVVIEEEEALSYEAS